MTKGKSRKTGPTIEVHVVVLPHGAGLPLPQYQTEGAAGLDLLAAVPEGKSVRLAKGKRALIPTGLVIQLPPGTEAQVRPRSGLAIKHGVTVLNSPGTIDCDYRGEVQVILVNLGERTFAVKRGERIAQLIIAPVTHAELSAKALVSTTARGTGGFGSTGLAPLTLIQRRSAASKSAQTKKSNLMPPRAARAKIPARRPLSAKARPRRK